LPAPLSEIQDMVHILWTIGGSTKHINIVNLVSVLKEISPDLIEK